MTHPSSRPALSGGSLRRRRRLDALGARAFERFTALGALTGPQVRQAFDALAAEARSAGDVSDDVLAEGLALAARTSELALGLSPYPVQVLGSVVLASGAVAQMQTGEGKTLSTAMAAAVLTLPGRGVHVATANAYLAARDAALLASMGDLLGFTVGVSAESGDLTARQGAHACDVVYGTATSLGFDYLYDNLAIAAEEVACRAPYAALVDEADSVLLDEARTPLLISLQGQPTRLHFARFADLAAGFVEGVDVYVDLAKGAVAPLPPGIAAAEKALGVDGLYARPLLVQQLQTALTARFLYHRDVDYLVVERPGGPEVVLIDANTGRRRDRSRLSAGLHEALEAKEGVASPGSGVTRAATSIQAFFRRYPRLGGMTGTATTAADEFEEYYGLEVFAVPTNQPSRRIDREDRVFATSSSRDAVLTGQVFDDAAAGRPVLVLTDSIVECERLGELLRSDQRSALVDVRVLSARNPEQEADVFARAGEPGSVTVATAMAGRGVDILLGGRDAQPQVRDAVRAAGGLSVLSSCRFGSARVDQQLRGRSGRQGDPGSSQFFVSFDDELVSLYAPASLLAMVRSRGGDELSSALAASVFSRAQSSLEGEDRLSRRAVLRADAPLVAQRDEFYRYRRELLSLAPWPRAAAVVEGAFLRRLPASVAGRQDLLAALRGVWPSTLDLPDITSATPAPTVAQALTERFMVGLADRISLLADLRPDERQDLLTRLVGSLVLDSLDRMWARHLESALALFADSSLSGRVGQRPDGIYRSLLASSFREMFVAFETMALANLGGLRVDALSRRDETAPAS